MDSFIRTYNILIFLIFIIPYQRGDSSGSKADEDTNKKRSSAIAFAPLYISVAEWVLNKDRSTGFGFSKRPQKTNAELSSQSSLSHQFDDFMIIEENDGIRSAAAFHLLIQLYDMCDTELQQKIIIDIYFLIKHNGENKIRFLNMPEF